MEVSAMTTPLMLIGVIAAVGLLYVVVPIVLDTYRKYMGTLLVTCPETQQTAALELDAGHAALRAATGRVEVRVQDCSRWPERAGCQQECLRQI
jgi:hypothetical protein